tara:strand:+ start:605 stop:910 length:306 start_codon:yes stop_codon:yes gene_type:complete
MKIINSTNKTASGDVDKAILDYCEGEFQKEKQFETQRIQQVQSEIQNLKGVTNPAMGKCVASMPARDYYRLIKKYGVHQVHSKDFLKYFKKKMPELSPNNV